MISRRHKKRRETGAALVEMAIVLPLLVVLIFGVVEYGLLFKDKLTISSAANSAARTGATMGKKAEADIAILRALEAGFYDQVDPSVLVRVDIFKAVPGTGAKSGEYNRYTYNPLDSCKWVPCPDPDPGPATYGSPSLWGHPSNRDTTLDPGGGGLDVLGIEVVFEHTPVTGLIPGLDREFTELARVRLEPDVFGP